MNDDITITDTTITLESKKTYVWSDISEQYLQGTRGNLSDIELHDIIRRIHKKLSKMLAEMDKREMDYDSGVPSEKLTDEDLK